MEKENNHQNEIQTNINENNINTENSQKYKDKKNKKKMIFNFILIAIIFIGLTIYMISVDGIDNIINVLTSVNYLWVIRSLCPTFTNKKNVSSSKIF